MQPALANKFQLETDYSGPGFPITFGRTYNSIASGSTASPALWRHTFERLVLWLSTGTNATVAVVRQDGRIQHFTNSGGAWASDADVNDRLTTVLNGAGTQTGWQYIVSSDDSVESYDMAGNLLSVTYRGGMTLLLTYGSTPYPTGAPSCVRPTGSTAAPTGKLACVTDAFGKQLNFSYDSSSRLATVYDPAGQAIQYAYDSNGRLASVTFQDGKSRIYAYNESANTGSANLPYALTGITDESATRFATFKFDSQGRPLSTEHAGGVEKYSFSYGSGQTIVTDPLLAARTFAFSPVLGYPQNTSVSQPCSACGLSATTTYDANGNAATRTDFNGNQSQYTYDLTRNLESSRTEAYGTPSVRTIGTSWNANFRLPATITQPSRTTTYSYDSSGNALTKTITDTSVTPTVARTWTYTYNSFGRVLTVDGPRTDVSDISTYTYYTCTTGYQCGQLQTVTNAAGQTTTYNTYNAHGQPLTITDPNGIVTTLTYDARQRLTSRTTAGERTSFSYYPTGLLQTVTLPDTSYVAYTYDAGHRLTQITDGAGNKVVYTLDAMGNRIAENVSDPSSVLHRTHSRIINALNEVSQEVNAAGTAAVTTTFGYDNNGNQASIQAPLARNTANAYDELNRLTQITDPASGVTKFGYDANDNLTAVTDPRNLSTTYGYNGFGDLTTQSSPDTGGTTNTYDSGGNLSTSTDARGAVSTYSYDALNRVTSVAYSTGGTTDQTITFTYDAGTNGKGHLTGASDANHSLAWSFDALGRVTDKTQVVGGISKSVGYGYTSGDLTTLTTPSGQQITYTFNGNHQIASIAVNGGTVVTSVGYEPLGPVNGWTWGNGTTTTRTYDLDGKIGQLVSNGTKAYTYDNAFRITGITDTSSGASNWTYGYDALDRITSGSSSSISRGWTYDANGNRLTETGSSPSTYSIAPASNQITAIAGTLARTYGYDAAGHITSYSSMTATYNNAGRLKTVSNGSATETLVYNALGQRIATSGGAAGTVLYWYDEQGHLLGEYDGSGNLVEETVWLGDIPVATLRPSGSGVAIYYVHTDQLNTPRQVTRPSDNAQMWTWLSDPFGTDAANANPSGAGAFAYNLRFPGQVFDGQVGLHLNGFRDYDPATGRYVESDPIGLAGGSYSTYAYVVGNPLSYVDGTGTGPIGSAIGGQIGGWIGGIAGAEVGPLDPLAVAIGRAAGSAIGSAIEDSCKDKKCPPCKTVSGRVVPVGTVGYRPLDVIPDDVKEHGVYGSHHNLFKANQMPYPKCDCFWQKLKDVAKPSQLQPGWVPIEPFVN